MFLQMLIHHTLHNENFVSRVLTSNHDFHPIRLQTLFYKQEKSPGDHLHQANLESSLDDSTDKEFFELECVWNIKSRIHFFQLSLLARKTILPWPPSLAAPTLCPISVVGCLSSTEGTKFHPTAVFIVVNPKATLFILPNLVKGVSIIPESWGSRDIANVSVLIMDNIRNKKWTGNVLHQEQRELFSFKVVFFKIHLDFTADWVLCNFVMTDEKLRRMSRMFGRTQEGEGSTSLVLACLRLLKTVKQRTASFITKRKSGNHLAA